MTMHGTLRTSRVLAKVVVVTVLAAVACSKNRDRAAPMPESAVAANVAPACVCGQYSPLFCESLTKMCATDKSDPDCDDLDVACVCAPPDEHGVCNK